MMHQQDDLWLEFRKRREEWRARRNARRRAWREAWRAGACAPGWGHGDWGRGDWGGETADVAALKAKVEDMQKTIDQLNERIIVLEKLATNDDARLAAEIEKLRSSDE